LMKTWSQALTLSRSTASWKTQALVWTIPFSPSCWMLPPGARRTSYQDLEENLTVVSVVELVAGGVQELVDGIQV
jgi:hypothetical protein